MKLLDSEAAIVINISWSATTLVGIDQNYSVFLESHIELKLHSFTINITELSTLASIKLCGTFLAYVTAVNGAGESDPSNNVTIPSLPDIGPIPASLTHQVWKSGGEIIVNVSFEVSLLIRRH